MLEKNRLSVLIVEDDHELRGFIKSVLLDYYEVYEAQDGKEGYDNTIKYMPDFILSDIMMPKVDGMEFLQKVRANQETSHIPFILLTAKTNIDDQLKGITSGADDYITKPFSVKLLIAKIDNIIKQRKLYAAYIGNDHSGEIQEEEHKLVEQNKITEQDELFIRRLKDDIYNNLDNGDFTIDSLVANTNLSRRVFFNKVKSLTGQAPVEFVREIRISHAAQLLKTQQYRIKEVTYMVGFSDIRYFTQCFKDMFGMTPSQYKDQFKES
jgi:DNA-binding response OmpR family regulator